LGGASWRRVGAGALEGETRGLAVRSQAGAALMLVLPGEGGCLPGDAAAAFGDTLGAAPGEWIDLATHRIAALDDAGRATIGNPFVLR
ncbi:MAG: hypothetical protein R3286_12000, partial [Gammaproteobacteria bacterium]|nr:hypothetical protein [Gammaproteobacteria bacterium]